MAPARIGQLLSRLARITNHDIEEILQEQIGSRQKFGDIALSWGLCRPEHVWQAWCEQLGDSLRTIDLDKVGIDTQALAYLPRELAEHFRAVPVRMFGDRLIVAIAAGDHQAKLHLQSLLAKNLQFVFADAEQIDRMIAMSYAGPMM